MPDDDAWESVTMYIYTNFEFNAYMMGVYLFDYDKELRISELADPIVNFILSQSKTEARLRSQSWMYQIPAKRLTAWCIYGDILSKIDRDLTVLDIAGGYSGLTKILASNCTYTLVDPLIHDDYDDIRALLADNPHEWSYKRWEDFKPQGTYDIIICNDLFPNADQRLELFLKKYLPICKELRMTLTFYNKPLSVRVSQYDGAINGCEYSLLLWNGEQLKLVLDRYKHRIKGSTEALDDLGTNASLFEDKRQVCYIEFTGGLA